MKEFEYSKFTGYIQENEKGRFYIIKKYNQGVKENYIKKYKYRDKNRRKEEIYQFVRLNVVLKFLFIEEEK